MLSCLSVDEPESIVEFSLTRDNVVWAAQKHGNTEAAPGAIPRGGGACSAQTADLHSVWMCKTLVHLPQSPGMSGKTSDGVAQWSSKNAVVALQEFRDHRAMAAKGPALETVMGPVCAAFGQAWVYTCDVNPAARARV